MSELEYCYEAQFRFTRSDWNNPGFEAALRLQFEAHVKNIKSLTEDSERRMKLGESVTTGELP